MHAPNYKLTHTLLEVDITEVVFLVYSATYDGVINNDKNFKLTYL